MSARAAKAQLKLLNKHIVAVDIKQQLKRKRGETAEEKAARKAAKRQAKKDVLKRRKKRRRAQYNDPDRNFLGNVIDTQWEEEQNLKYNVKVLKKKPKKKKGRNNVNPSKILAKLLARKLDN